jgi:hypothetical protein
MEMLLELSVYQLALRVIIKTLNANTFARQQLIPGTLESPFNQKRLVDI